MSARSVVVLLVAMALAACQPPESQTPAAASFDQQRMATWSRSCGLCHARGEGGAPVLGDLAAWAPRIAQGEDVLLQHTIEGLNNMPPLGYCMSCESEDLLWMIRFMVDSVQPAQGADS